MGEEESMLLEKTLNASVLKQKHEKTLFLTSGMFRGMGPSILMIPGRIAPERRSYALTLK